MNLMLALIGSFKSACPLWLALFRLPSITLLCRCIISLAAPLFPSIISSSLAFISCCAFGLGVVECCEDFWTLPLYSNRETHKRRTSRSKPSLERKIPLSVHVYESGIGNFPQINGPFCSRGLINQGAQARTTATATKTLENNDLIGRMRKNNRAARAARTLIEFFDVVG